MTGLKRELGGSVQYRRFKAGGFYWTPNTTESNVSFFGFQERKFFGLTGQGSFRGEYSIINPETRRTYSNIDSDDVNRKTFAFLSLSGALIKSWDKWQFSTTLMSVGRTPGIEDLYSDGPHLGSYSYEIGNPNLGLEKTVGVETTLQYQGGWLFFMINGFVNNSPNFHQYTKMGACADPFVPGQQHPCAGADFIEWGSGSSGWLYKYRMVGLKTQISGGEVQLTYYGKRFDITTDFSLVRGIDTSNQNHLPYMPADKMKILFSTKSDQDLTGTLRLTKGFRQNRTSEFETITPGYFLIDIFGSYSFNAFNSSHRLIFQLNNLLDETYYNHLSKIKLIMPESGRSINLQYRYLF
jgi:iron complex outermembrane receptor protein